MGSPNKKSMIFQVTTELPRATLNVFIGESLEHFKEYITKELGNYSDPDENKEEDIKGFFYSDFRTCPHGKKRKSYLWLEDLTLTPESLSVLSHELNHYTFTIFDHYGIMYGTDNDEMFCYFQDHYFKKILIQTNMESWELPERTCAVDEPDCESCQ